MIKPADKPAPAKPETTQPAPELNKKQQNQLKRLNLLKLHQLKNKLTTNKLLEWNASQAQSSNGCTTKLQSDLTAAVQAKDEKKIEEAIKTFNKLLKIQLQA